jgi:acetyltransferase
MINKELLEPGSIVIVGGSNDIHKPGGKIIKNILDGGFKGKLYVVNPKEAVVQGIACMAAVEDLPDVDLAIMAIAARHIPKALRVLAEKKNTRAFIVISAGFSEESKEGSKLEEELVGIVDRASGCLIGPNCIGVLTPAYQGVFTLPIPRLEKFGCDFISGSGATACFIMETGIPKGLRFSHVFSVGNSAQIGVEEILEYLDETFHPNHSSKVKILYLEDIANPQKLLRHASSLILKGCRIAAIKAGASEAGIRAASSHTGALASSDLAVEALFRKAGIVRCHGREELINVALVFMHPALPGRRMGIITHAGGPAVMLTDALAREGFEVPPITNPRAAELLGHLHPGSSVANPIDFLATGTAEQLGMILDYTDRYFDEIDAMTVIFGTPGLFPVSDVYALLDEKMKHSIKPIFPILPSTMTAAAEVNEFTSRGRVYFPDEVMFAKALGMSHFAPVPFPKEASPPFHDIPGIRSVISKAPDGYLSQEDLRQLLGKAGIRMVPEIIARSGEDAVRFALGLRSPVVMKANGPLHKSDGGGVKLGLKEEQEIRRAYHDLMAIPGSTGVLVQPMVKGTEVFAGLKAEGKFGCLVLCGLGGIYIEALKDFTAALAPVCHSEALDMIKRLKSYRIIEGIRGQAGIDPESFADIIVRLSWLAALAPEIREADLNPLIGSGSEIFAVDARVRVEKSV